MTEKLCDKAICSDYSCTGCMACVNSCRHGAIIECQNDKGFYRPTIVEDKCVNCGACVNVCPTLHPLPVNNYKHQAWCCVNKSMSIRMDSSSGGLFSAIAEYVLAKGGVVYGAMFDECVVCVISNSEDQHGIDKFRGSKYVQARIGSNIFLEIKRRLAKGQLVMYTGTPCQIAGLKGYLKKEYDNLLTVDFLCHGVPSPLVHKDYVKYREGINKSPITLLKHRDKHKSWRIFNFLIKYGNGDEQVIFRTDDPFYQIFLRDYSVQETCFNCLYTKAERGSDITMADYWSKIGKRQLHDDDNGISLILLNSDKAVKIFNSIRRNLGCQELDFEAVRQKYPYLRKPTAKPALWDNFWMDMNLLAFNEILNKYGYPARKSLADKVIMRFGKTKWNALLLRILWKYDYIMRKLKNNK